MHHIEEWKALAARIRGLVKAGRVYRETIRESDSYRVGRTLGDHCKSTVEAIRSFRARFANALSPSVIEAIDRYIERPAELLADTGGGPLEQTRALSAMLLMSALESEVSFLLSSTQELIHVVSERAFLHLQRLIVADESYRQKWHSAFDEGEVACEKLGAVHLLWHGIWSFKVDTTGARTDLVLQERARDLAVLERAVLGLILTEWKLLRDGDDAGASFKEAREQARIYTTGALSAHELAAYRYAVIVSREQTDVPPDVREDEVVYRNVNISIAPLTPSREARRRRRSPEK